LPARRYAPVERQSPEPPMKRVTKIVLSLAGLVLVLLIAGVIVLLVSVNSVARRGVEVGGTYALGVPTTVKAIDVGLLSGKVGLDSLRVANAPGFPTDHFLTLGDGKVEVKLSTLTSEVIYIPQLSLSNIDVALEKKEGKSNYQVILDNLQKLTGPPGSKPPEPKEGSQKKLIIHELTIRNVNVHADLLGGPGVIGAVTKVNVPLAEIKLTDVGQTGSGVAGSGVTFSELAGLVVQAVLAAAVEKGGLPADVMGDLKGQLAKIQDLAGGVGKQVEAQAKAAAEQLQKQAEQVGQDLQKKAEGELQKQAEKLGEGLKGIIPGGGEKKK
jgi:hypothetical protein